MGGLHPQGLWEDLGAGLSNSVATCSTGRDLDLSVFAAKQLLECQAMIFFGLRLIAGFLDCDASFCRVQLLAD